MALARAFTRRHKRNSDESNLARGGSVKFPTGTIKRNLISLPTELISTTNVHALSAPDIASLNSSSSNSSIKSSNDSDMSSMARSFLDSPATSPDCSSAESSPVATGRSFFDAAPKHSVITDDVFGFEAPEIPKRVPSHTKKAHVELSRRRSKSRLSPPPTTLAGPAVVSHTVDMFSPVIEADHPFGKELAKVNEVAEEFGITTSLLHDEEQDLINRGLCKFRVEEYLDEIAGLYGGVFEDQLGPLAKPWI